MANRFLLIFLLTAIFSFSQEKPVVVLELFTSQGCSSCPPADKVLDKIKHSADPSSVIPIAYHVDYWDYIGWKDPFASNKYTNKQRDYAQKFYSSSIYTPQLVINGDEHFVGSNEIKINRKIKQILHRKSSSNSISISDIKTSDDKVLFSYQINGKIKKHKISYLLIIDERITSVKRGENRNRVLKNTNIVVREKSEVLNVKEGKAEIAIPKIVSKKDKLRLVVLVKDKESFITTGIQVTL
ncbi:DUF1223 domain-containing protein [Tenacibaculum agarivorans]|uniref:DUF1223 domain-containing protein n=1 Tax=Tenacibaculum agarivorans TaxID=1908389 RepID=UPI00094B7ADC|nr:DUF1223 domain-containing protein [Tenacibaculum agarivorans]